MQPCVGSSRHTDRQTCFRVDDRFDVILALSEFRPLGALNTSLRNYLTEHVEFISVMIYWQCVDRPRGLGLLDWSVLVLNLWLPATRALFYVFRWESLAMFRLHRAAGLIEGVSSKVHKLNIQCNGFRSSVVRQCDNKAEETIRGTPYKDLVIGVPKETFKNERRVAIVPATVQKLIKKGFSVTVEESAGVLAKFGNDDFAAAGASLKSAEDVFKSDIVLKVRAPTPPEIQRLRDENTLISFLYPAQNKELIDLMAKRHSTVFAMDCVPRISRAQVFDALSSMANISGYKAVIEAANHFGRFFTGEFLLHICQTFFTRFSCICIVVIK